MKKYIIRTVVSFILTFIGIFCYCLLTGKINLKELLPQKLHISPSSDTYIEVKIPIDGEGILTLQIDGDNELICTNEYNFWRYSNTLITTTYDYEKGKPYTDKVMFKNQNVYRKYGNTYVIVSDSQDKLGYVIKSLEDEPIPNNKELDNKYRVKAIPDYDTPLYYEELENGIIRPTVGESSNSVKGKLVYGAAGYCYQYTTYGEFEEIVKTVSDRLENIAGNDISLWYQDGVIFYAECGNRYIGVRSVNSNTHVVSMASGEENKNYVLSTLFGIK